MQDEHEALKGFIQILGNGYVQIAKTYDTNSTNITTVIDNLSLDSKISRHNALENATTQLEATLSKNLNLGSIFALGNLKTRKETRAGNKDVGDKSYIMFDLDGLKETEYQDALMTGYHLAGLLLDENGKLANPSALIYTGGGFHLYYMLAEPIKEVNHDYYSKFYKVATKTLQNLIDRKMPKSKLVVDMATSDLARLSRGPFSINWKYKRKVEPIFIEPKLSYMTDTFNTRATLHREKENQLKEERLQEIKKKVLPNNGIDAKEVKNIAILDVARLLGLKVTTSGYNHFVKCLYHQEKTASMSLNTKDNYFKCFGCNKSGDVIELVQKVTGLSFPEAIKYLQTNFNLSYQYEKGVMVYQAR